MPTYKTPNVYIEEISTFPPSVAEVSTAIPAFIGNTEKAVRREEDLTLKPTRISSILDYETLFGGAEPTALDISTDDEGQVQPFTPPEVNFLMYYALRMYFDNGGGSCYIVSVGSYDAPATADAFREGLDALKKEDEPTLILLTDAIKQLDDIDYIQLCQQVLLQCNQLGDRFGIFDVKDEENGVETFRQGIGIESLKYGAAYYPYLQTSLPYYYTDQSVTLAGVALEDDSIKNQQTELYNKIKAEVDKKRVVLPPSAAVAGAYAKVDRDRGVWKAPANVSLASVIGPTLKITNEEQEDLNVDPTAGKSINAIRSFTGKGTLIWGARTLAGNDNEWRYVPVRRLFNLVEESLQKATAFVVFESNNAITWLKVKTMVETYLESLWRKGALAGSTPEQAFFVNVGLGKSMTNQDILEGRLIVEIGLAAVRPAEFVILKFSHKLQES
ncbi:MAG: phage tail sheath C-terminal domain-containing protein [Cyanobacteria bacterium P01_F01_bin.150]